MKNRKTNWLVVGILGLLGIAAGSYFWANAIIGALMEYRSPIAASAPAPGEQIGEPLTRKVILVLLDALREDTALDPQVMPYLNSLRQQGASASLQSRQPSLSAPGWTTLLTGAWPEINDAQQLNPPDNVNVRPFTQDDIFAAAERAGLTTAVSGYSWFEQMLQGSGVDAGFFTPADDAAADREVVDSALPWLDANYQLILIHLDQVDYAGHYQGGPLGPEWAAAAGRVDGLLEEITSRLDLQQDTLLVLSDHGQIDPGGHGGSELVTLIEPFVLLGAGVRPGNYGTVQMVDVAPTLAALLGLNIPASNQGEVLLDMLLLPETELPQVRQALESQQNLLLQAYTAGIDSSASILSGGVSVKATQNAIAAARAGRLARERVWRNVLAVFIAFLPGYFLFLRREKRALWMLLGVLAYLLVFNLRYAVIDGHTYSLSSIPEQMAFILYTAKNTAIALLPAWLMTMLGLRAFRAVPRRAASLSLGFLWVLLYALSLPVALNFAVNGPISTWTLPDFVTQFHGLFAIIQALFIACLGLPLVGITALVGRFRKN